MLLATLTHPQIDPVAIRFSENFGVHWYGLMYVLAFIVFLMLGKYRARQAHSPIKPAQVDDLMFYGAVGVIVGGRLGYMLFYNLENLIQNPATMIRVWEGGMSFHGGLIGVTIAMWLLVRKWKLPLLTIGDFIAPLIPVGLGLGRVGNFIGQELVGRPTDAPWGMIFPKIDNLARHPSQLYQAFIEGIILFTIVWLFSGKSRPTGSVTGLFLMIYAIGRFLVEFFRTPDAHIGFDAFGWLTRGQLLSIPMFLIGLILFVYSHKKEKKHV